MVFKSWKGLLLLCFTADFYPSDFLLPSTTIKSLFAGFFFSEDQGVNSVAFIMQSVYGSWKSDGVVAASFPLTLQSIGDS